jgi:hypothetical protein
MASLFKTIFSKKAGYNRKQTTLFFWKKTKNFSKQTNK